MAQMLGGQFGNILANRKSTTDFMREAEEFEAKKRANVLGEKMAQIGLIQAERDLAQPQGAFTGDSWDAQVGNVAYEKFLSDGLDPMSAKQAAADAVLKSKMDYTMVTDPYTGQQTPVAKPRAAIFGGGQTAPSYGGGIGAQGQGSNPAIELPYDQIPPLDLKDVESRIQDAGPENSEFNPNSPGMNLPGAKTAPKDDILNMPAAQGAAADRGQYGPYIDPRAMNSPDVQKDLARKQGEMQLKSQDPEFLLKQKELGLKENTTKEAKVAVSNFVNEMAKGYQSLYDIGAAVSSDRPASQNIPAYLRSTSVGQIGERAMGTEAQAIRDKINNNQPNLINAIRQATGMSAKAMDSNRELQFYLQATGDPTRDVKSNLAALQVINDSYGLGSGRFADPAEVEKLKAEMSKNLNPNKTKGSGESDLFEYMTPEERALFQ